MQIIVIIRNLVFTAVLAWLGLEFAPDQNDAPENAPQDSVLTKVLG